MFNKNDFKEQFRIWTEENPKASLEEAKKLCELLIPAEYKETYSWLEEQSLAWFAWKKENFTATLLQSKSELEEFILPHFH